MEKTAAPVSTAAAKVAVKAPRVLDGLSREAARLEAAVKASRTRAAELGQERAQLHLEISASEKGEEAVKDEMAAAVVAEEELVKRESRLEREVIDMRRNERIFEVDVPVEDKGDGEAEEVSPEDKAARRMILRTRGQIQVERSATELAELRREELELEIEQVQEEIAEAMAPEFFEEETQLAWHKEALRRYVQDHKNAMQRLKIREGELERAKHDAAEADKDVDIEALKKECDAKRHMAEKTEREADTARKSIEERRAIQGVDTDYFQVAQDLESEMKLEIDRQTRILHSLEEVVLALHRGRREGKRRQSAAEAEQARLEIRMQAVREQRTMLGIGGDSNPAVPLEAKEIDAVKVGAAAQGAVAHAVAWSSSLPSSLKDATGLGMPFTTLVGLHRVFWKAQFLACSIHQHYIQDPTLAVLQADVAMEWLTRACLAATQIGYSGVSVLGRLRSMSAHAYGQVIRGPAVKSISSSERHVDEALRVVQSFFMEDALPRETLKQVLRQLEALGAQMLSVEKSSFKKEPFASWQSAACAVEACRATCALVLYASADAGGTRRARWQGLYGKADRVRASLAGLRGRSGFFEIGPNLIVLAPPPPALVEGGGDAEVEDGEIAAPVAEASRDAAVDKTLDQRMLDDLLKQVKVLESFAYCEPAIEADAEALDYAFTTAENSLATVGSVVNRASVKAPAVPPVHAEFDPWNAAPVAMAAEIQAAEEQGKIEEEAAAKELKQAEASMDTVKSCIEAMKGELREVEAGFGQSRVGLECHRVMEEQLGYLRRQMRSNESLFGKLSDELNKEQGGAQKMKLETESQRKRCRELQQQLEEAEARIMKMFSDRFSPEEVMALRRNDKLQHEELVEIKGRYGHRLRAGDVESVADFFRRDGLLRMEGAMNSMVLNKKHDADRIESIWHRVQKLQATWLRERAGISVLRLGDSSEREANEKAERAASDQRSSDLRHIAQALSELEQRATGLIADGGRTGSVPFSRFAQAVSGARALQCSGPAVKVSLPLGGAWDSKSKRGGVSVIAALGDLQALADVHRALL